MRRHESYTRGLISFAVVLATSFATVSMECLAEPDLLSRPVAAFKATDITPLEAILRVGEEQAIPIGIIYSDNALLTSQVSVEVSQSTVRGVLLEILQTAPGYQAVEKPDGAVLIAVPEAMKAQPLYNYRLSRFSFPGERSALVLSAFLWGELQVKLDAKRKGYGGVIQSPPSDRSLPPIDLHNVSVGRILDWIVVHHGAMAWIMWPPPSDLVEAPQKRLWNLVFYGDPTQPAANYRCCVHIPDTMDDVPQALKSRLEESK